MADFIKQSPEAAKKAADFLTKHHFSLRDFDDLSQKLRDDMKNALEKKTAMQPMIFTGTAGLGEITEGESAIIIDAGGTNFRSCIATKTRSGLEISDFEKSRMPGVEKELSKDEFYGEIAARIERLKDRSSRIGFCFSYAMEITDDGDGKILQLAKEVKAPKAEGTFLARELSAVLYKNGWQKLQKIAVLNDTAASLLSNILQSSENGKNFDSYASFILGTGLNSAFVKDGKIYVTECGLFRDIVQSDFDVEVDKNSALPGKSVLEKMCSGAYLGKIVYAMAQAACKENLFSDDFCGEFKNITEINPVDFDEYFSDKDGSKIRKLLALKTDDDKETLEYFIRIAIERAALICANCIEAIVQESLAGAAVTPNGTKTASICCNGSTFWKTHGLCQKVQELLQEKFAGCGVTFRIINIDDDITKGAFAAAFKQ